ncbi:hypothetical protein KSP40_PGU000306 [Platanthera guangdongensis]|uniref:Uncharacterized protein n=1 Tax=Platanthera guangdongensis TaxID=2320717 RepID=A0ABR2MS75_9ASPA
MDFVHGLPRSLSGDDVVWVIVDLLTKLSHFIRNKKGDSVEKFAKLYVDNCWVYRSQYPRFVRNQTS